MTDIQIFEPIYAAGQELIEPAFKALPIANERAPWREFAIMVDMYRAGLHRGSKLTGVLSPKFCVKTGLSGPDLIAFIEANPGHDVYLANSGAWAPYSNFNVWEHAEANHPGIVAAAQALLDAVGIDWDLSNQPRHGHDVFLFSNFWVGTEAFWDSYVGGILVPIASFIEQHPTHPASIGIFEDTNHTTVGPYLPFVIERMISTYLKLHPSLSIGAWQRDPIESCLTQFERETIAYMAPILAEAEGTEFSDDLRRLMRFLSKADAMHKDVHYRTVQHPHTIPPSRRQTTSSS